MRIDLRDVSLPTGRTDLNLDMGMGEIQLLVPDDMCVTTEAQVGVGAINTGSGEQGGIDVDVDESHGVTPGARELHVVADVGIGHLQIGDSFFSFDGPGFHDSGFDTLRSGTSAAACRVAA
jgi:predicted membrane protein